MPKTIRRALHRFVPAHFHDPLGLTIRILRSRHPAAYAALARAPLQALLSPLDLVLGQFERKLYQRAEPPRLPIIMVAGAPRSGTTLLHQTLISSLPLAYINNLATLFPHAPILINKLVRRPFRNERIGFNSFYGKSSHWYGPNDGLNLWDRWFGSDRTVAPSKLDADASEQLQQFFGAFEATFQRPLIVKNNALNNCAHLIAPILPTAIFLCMKRDPLYLAQSLLIARREIHGDDSLPYGIDHRKSPSDSTNDVLESICQQVTYHQRQEALQIERVGSDRFWIIDYETFCRDPSNIVRRVAKRVFGDDMYSDEKWENLAPFSISKARKLPERDFDRLACMIAETSSRP